jgi:(3R)-3-[(carboxylmethyl)amino]fatty acid synthase
VLLVPQIPGVAADGASAVDPQLLARVLRPYKPHCRYLRTAAVRHPRAARSIAVASGTFAIPESCYIASTGHFNAVEFNICYNQLTYCLLAKCIEDEALAVLDGWTLARFSQHQLSDYLIARFFSAFHKPLTAQTFQGEVEIVQIVPRRGATFMKTVCRFSDQGGGRAEGGATIAIISAEHVGHEASGGCGNHAQ